MSGFLQAADPPLVLASTSATRAALLRSAGIAFETAAPGVDEAAVKESAKAEGLSAEECALLLAEMKARRVGERRPEALVIGADQILVCDGVWFDKPQDQDAAARQLAALAGRPHALVTAVVCFRGGVRVWQTLAVPQLALRALRPETIAAYVAAAGDAVRRTVGAYAVEGLGMRLMAEVSGEHSAILGLPLLPLLGFLRQHGVLRD
ncbi:MAG: Maf family nucleotide pyrophosphatase [Elioraea sp.]|nr:Maf family nucleotide pyrophosphatase [Elioraea sp.]